jgi:CheY-like chemotaxis protein
MSNVVRLAGPGQPRTVLLVEPNAPSRIEIASYLRSRDYCVVEAINGEEALRLLRSGRIAHIMLSGADLHETAEGGRLATAVAREFPHLQILGARGRTKHGPDLRRLERAIRDALSDRTQHN